MFSVDAATGGLLIWVVLGIVVLTIAFLLFAAVVIENHLKTKLEIEKGRAEVDKEALKYAEAEYERRQ